MGAVFLTWGWPRPNYGRDNAAPPSKGLMPAICASQDFCSQFSLTPRQVTVDLYLPGNSWALINQSGSVSCGVMLLSPGTWYAQCFVCALQKSLFPPVLWKICNQIPVAFKAKFPRGSQSLCLVPRLEICCGPRTFTTVWELVIIVLSLWFTCLMALWWLMVTSSRALMPTPCLSKDC